MARKQQFLLKFDDIIKIGASARAVSSHVVVGFSVELSGVTSAIRFVSVEGSLFLVWSLKVDSTKPSVPIRICHSVFAK